MERLKKELRIGAAPESGERTLGGAKETGAKWPKMFDNPITVSTSHCMM